MQTNDKGQVALKRLKQNQKVVEINQNKGYVFIPKFNICMAWVDPEDVDKILAMKSSCCGGTPKQEFWYAHERDVAMWNGQVT